MSALKRVVERARGIVLTANEKVKVGFILRQWRRVQTEIRRRREIGKVLARKTKENCVREFLKAWRAELHLQQLQGQMALPFLRHIMRANSVREAFEALKQHRIERIQKRVRVQTSHDFYKFSLESKSFETLKWYKDTKIEERNKIEFIKSIKHPRLLAASLQGLKDHVVRRKWLALKQT